MKPSSMRSLIACWLPRQPPELVLSHALSPLDADLRQYFQARVAESLRLAAYPVVADPSRTAPTPDLGA